VTTAVNPLQGKALRSAQLATAAGNLWEGAVRSGKTIASILRWLEFVRHGPPGPLLMIGKTERTLRRNVLDTMMSMLGPSRMKIISGAGEVDILGRKIYLTGAHNIGAADKIRGMTLVGWYGDEITTWPEDVFDIARTRLSLDGAAWFGTCNPDSPVHWLKKKHVDRAELHITRDGQVRHFSGERLNLRVFSFTLRDNPALPAEFVHRLMREYTGVFYRRNILGEWVMAEGAIYQAWDEKYNVIPFAKIPPIDTFISTGVDYGTIHPFSAHLVGIGEDLRSDGMALYITDEYRYDPALSDGRQKSTTQYADAYLTWLNSTPIPGAAGMVGVAPAVHCVDPSAAYFRTELYNRGVETRGADNDVTAGISDMASLIANRKLYVSERCTGLITEIPGYSWDPKAALRGVTAPLKAGDDGCDSARYGIRTPRSYWHDLIYDYA
jgi:PBSX family phage terminase large subunit